MKKSGVTVFSFINIVLLITAFILAKNGIYIMSPVYITCGGGGLTIYKADFAKGLLLVAAGCVLPIIVNMPMHFIYKRIVITKKTTVIFSAAVTVIVMLFSVISIMVEGYPNYWNEANWI